MKLVSIIREPEFGFVALRLEGVDWSAVMNARDDLDLRSYDVPPVDRSALDRLREQLDEATRELEAASAKVAGEAHRRGPQGLQAARGRGGPLGEGGP
jgi:hypothetical protein